MSVVPLFGRLCYSRESSIKHLCACSVVGPKLEEGKKIKKSIMYNLNIKIKNTKCTKKLKKNKKLLVKTGLHILGFLNTDSVG